MIDINFNSQVFKDRLGYYVVGDKKFYNKGSAYYLSHTTKQPVKFVFNDQIYGGLDWSIPIDTPLTDLYKNRAVQIRNAYDYIMVYFSGGIDSVTVLRSFIDNNIFVDEIVLLFPVGYHCDVNSSRVKYENHFGEIEHSANVFLKNNAHLISPKTKITFLDVYSALSSLSLSSKWVESSMDLFPRPVISSIACQAAISRHEQSLEQGMKGKYVAKILGIDKPIVRLIENNLWLHFHDVHNENMFGTSKNVVPGLENTEFTELFFWTPHMPEIVIKQAQVISTAIMFDSRLVQTCAIGSVTAVAGKRVYGTVDYENKIAKLIYTHNKDVLWQVEKPPSSVVWFGNTSPKYNFFYKTATKNQLSNLHYGMQHLRDSYNANTGLEIETPLTDFSRKYLVKHKCLINPY